METTRRVRAVRIPLLLTVLVTAAAVASAARAGADTAPPDGTPATVSADALPTVQVSGIVWAQTMVGDIVYAAGRFTKARPAGSASGVNTSTRANLLAYDVTTGKLLPFSHALNGEGRAITASPDGTRLYVGGAFTTVDGATHKRLAAFDLRDGSLVSSFKGGTSSTVYALAATDSTVYAGGNFSSSASGQRRGRLISFAADGTLRDWKPSADAKVSAMVMSPDRSKVIFGGSFASVNGATYHALAAVDADTGNPLPWASQSPAFPIREEGATSGITSLSANDDTVFFTGYNYGNIAKYGGFEGRAAMSPFDGHIIWINDCHGDSYDAFPIGDVLYSVGHAHDCSAGGYYRDTDPRTWHRALAETVYPTHLNGKGGGGYYSYRGWPASTLLDWFPSVNTGSYSGAYQGGWSVTGTPRYVAMGGEFTKVNGRPQQALARFAIAELATNKIGPAAYSGAGVTASQADYYGRVTVSWRTTWDPDNGILTYRLYREGTSDAVYVGTADSRFWSMPSMSFTDDGRTPGSRPSYVLTASDPFGNTVTTRSG